jgi:hypothetical protein
MFKGVKTGQLSKKALTQQQQNCDRYLEIK